MMNKLLNKKWTASLLFGLAMTLNALAGQAPHGVNRANLDFDHEAALVRWAFNDATTCEQVTSVTPADAFTVTAVNLGDITVTGTGTGQAKDDSGQKITFVKLQPAGSTTAVEWTVKPSQGLTFTPTRLSAYIQRFGTDAENGVVVTARLADGTSEVLGTYTAPRNNKTRDEDKYGANENYTNRFVIELTEEQQAKFTSSDGFSMLCSVGVNSGKEGGFSDVRIEGYVDGTLANVDKYRLTAVADPAEGGDISVYPMADRYDAGSQVTLTATPNFGYRFTNWTDGAGNEVSAEERLTYTVTHDETLTAHFLKTATYALNYHVQGTNAYMVQPSPAPTVVDGRNLYEEGTVVTLTANQYEGLVNFSNWSDGRTESEITITMNGDYDITALYEQADIIAGWDFYRRGNNGRPADFYAEGNDVDAFCLVNEADGTTSAWLDKSTEAGGGYESFKGAAVNWRTGETEGDVGHYYWKTSLNAEAFTDLQLQFQMMYNYNAYTTYQVEYSIDDTTWTPFGTITMEGAKNAATFNGALPSEANNQPKLYVRWTPDKTSEIKGTSSVNDGNTIAMVFFTGTPKIIDDGKAPVLASSVPADGSANVSANGKIVLTFDEKVTVDDQATALLTDNPASSSTDNIQLLTPQVSGKTVTFEYKQLKYNTQYEFWLDGNKVSDLTGNTLSEPITFHFTTMSRPVIEKGMYDFVVPTDGDIAAAIKAANGRSNKQQRYRIFVMDGTHVLPFSETATIHSDDGNTYASPITYISAPNISFIGESMEGTVITQNIPADATYQGQYGTTSVYDGIGKSDVLQLQSAAQNTYFQDLTVKSGIEDARGRNIAIQDKGTRTIYKNTCLWGYQDTWDSNNDRGLYYFENGKVRGRTDFLCGKGDAYFNEVDIQVCMNTGGYIAVPSNSIKYGYVFYRCTIKGENEALNGNYTLGRPWGKGTPVASWIHTTMEVQPSAIGWSEMSDGWPKRFAEYKSVTANGTLVDLSGRKTVFANTHTNNPILTDEEAAEASDMTNLFGSWDPRSLTEQASAPTHVVKEGAQLTWDDSPYVLLWAIVKNGKVTAFTNTPSFTVDDPSATYAVRAANEMGGLGEATTAIDRDAIEDLIATPVQSRHEGTYTLQGVKVTKAERGVYIVDGQKVVVR